MNCTVYLFGKLSNSYTQYPDDYSRSIFTKFHDYAKATTQIAVHRTSNLMYYGYIRKLEEGQYVGLCVLLNDVYLTKLDGLFSLFENTISNMVSKGFLINYDDKGNIVGNADKLYLNKEEVDLISESLKIGFTNLESSAKKLPPLNYGINKDSVHEYTIDDETEEIITSTFTHGFTYIYKSKGYNTAQMNSYKGVLARITNDRLALKEENQKLKEENEKIQKQKKQFRNVILLILIVIGCAIGIYFLNQNLNNTQNQLNDANNTITAKNSVIKNKEDRIFSLKYSVDSLQSAFNKETQKRKAAEDKLAQFCSKHPFVVNSCSVSASAFTFSYDAIEEKTVTVTLKAYNESNSEVSSTHHTITLSKGNGTKSLSFNYALNSSHYYNVFLEYNDQIIAGKRW